MSKEQDALRAALNKILQENGVAEDMAAAYCGLASYNPLDPTSWKVSGKLNDEDKKCKLKKS